MTTTPLAAIPIVDSWVAAEGCWDGLPAIVRFRGELGQLVAHPELQQRLVIEWSFDRDGATGMPSPSDSEFMGAFEDAIVPALEDDHTAVLTVVITHNATRQWTFYCGQLSAVEDRINAALEAFPRLPITLFSDSDPDWDLYRQVVAGAK